MHIANLHKYFYNLTIMLHEILFALLGKTGNIIIEGNEKFFVDPSIDFITESEQ